MMASTFFHLGRRLSVPSENKKPLLALVSVSGLAALGVSLSAVYMQGRTLWPWTLTLAPATVEDVSAERTMDLGDGECDCAAAWACMQSKQGGCEALVQQLRDCLARQKVKQRGGG